MESRDELRQKAKAVVKRTDINVVCCLAAMMHDVKVNARAFDLGCPGVSNEDKILARVWDLLALADYAWYKLLDEEEAANANP